jgi:hypothetical protein
MLYTVQHPENAFLSRFSFSSNLARSMAITSRLSRGDWKSDLPSMESRTRARTFLPSISNRSTIILPDRPFAPTTKKVSLVGISKVRVERDNFETSTRDLFLMLLVVADREKTRAVVGANASASWFQIVNSAKKSMDKTIMALL